MLYSGTTLTVSREGDVAELCFNNQQESVNKFDVQTVKELREALAVLSTDASVKGLLVTSAKSVFVVGADITEFPGLFTQGAEAIKAHIAPNVINNNLLEDLPFPTVAVINGFALGGGLEVALACDFRIAAETAQIGLPETKLGLIPGWGGTIRLPRLVGAETAIAWIAEGRNHKAAAAQKAGAVDEVAPADQLQQAAAALLNKAISGELDYQSRRAQKVAAGQGQVAATDLVEAITVKLGGHYPAPLLAIEVVEKSAGLPRNEAQQLELDAFARASLTPQAEAMVGVFLADQLVAKKAKAWEKQADKKIRRAGVLGAGIMGGGIAYQSALTGTPIAMKDIAQAGLDLGMSEADKLLSKQVSRGRLSEEKKTAILARIEPTLSYDNFGDVDMIVEAVVENPKVKLAVLAEAESKLAEDAILASNTSTISISYLAEALQRPENFCGMHFFNPVHAMPLVEVIRGDKTSDTAIARTVAYANAMGKKAIVVGDCPGFLVNRVLFPYFFAFELLLRDGADFQQVDRVMESWGWPMGPAYLADVVGIDTCAHCADVMGKGFPDRMTLDGERALIEMYKAERYGQKNTQGFYNYERDPKGRPLKLPAAEAYQLLEPYCAPRQDFSDAEIEARLMLPMAIELARCLEEGVVESAAEADMALLYGLGFPVFRGGVFRYLDQQGLDRVVAKADQLAPLGGMYQVTDTMREMAAAKKTYY